jgi:outer membrane protein insertion porin family
LRRAAGLWPCALALALACPAAARADVAAYLGKPVISVTLAIEGQRTTDESLTNLVTSLPGRPLSMIEVRETIGRLFSLGRFEDVQVDASPAAGGVALRYDLTPVHPVTKITFAGSTSEPGIDTSALRRAVVDRYGVSPSLGRADEMARVVADQLADGGYLHARVDPHAEIFHHPDRATLVFDVAPGPRTTIASIVIDGDAGVSRGALLDMLDVSEGDAYERQQLEDRFDRYLENRRKSAHYLAQISLSEELTDGDRQAHLTLTVDQGPVVQIAFAGDQLPANRLADLVPVEREGSADEDLLEDSSLRIEAFLRGQGYRDAAAPYTREETDGRLLITFLVHKGAEYRVATFDVAGNASIPTEALLPLLRTHVGGPFSQAALNADVAVIQAAYRRQGFASASATAASSPIANESRPDEIAVGVTITVVEGARTLVTGIEFTGNTTVPTADLRRVVGLEIGQPYVATQLVADQDVLVGHYADLGYPSTTVSAVPHFNTGLTGADVEFAIQEGTRFFVDHIVLIGNAHTSADTILRAMQLHPGDPIGRAALNNSQQRLVALGLFRRVRIEQVPHGSGNRRDIVVTVEEAPATTIGYGAGVEGRLRVVRSESSGGVASERFEVAPRASFDITRNNLFGKNRTLTFSTSFSLYPKDSPFFANQPQTQTGGGFGFAEYRLLGAYREPRLAGTDADFSASGTLEQQIRSSFNFARRTASATVTRRMTSSVFVTGGYQLQRTQVFDVQVDPSMQNQLDRTFSKYRLSSITGSIIRDTRNDTLNPSLGFLLSGNAQLAALNLGSEAGFTKLFLSGQAYHTVPHARGTVFAGSVRVGMGFPRQVISTQADGSRQTEAADLLPESERFFAGGDTTVRGFALDRLGTPATIVDGFPIGGDGLVILNAEMRVPLWGQLGAVGFVDSGNVFPHVSDIDLGGLRSSVGFGIRFGSPFGPIRADLGFKVHRQPGEGLTAFHLSFGQAF